MRKKEMTVLTIAFCISILIGIMIPKFFWQEKEGQTRIFDDERLQSYREFRGIPENLPRKIVRERFGMMLILFFGTYTAAGFWILLTASLYFGCTLGMLLAFMIWQEGLFGLLFLCCSLLPHWLLYGLAGYLTACFMRRRRERTFLCGENTPAVYNKKILMEFLKIFLLILLGSLLEIYFNPWLLKNFLNLF